MDSLHLTYDEVLYKIPYRNLIVMQKDKQHSVSSDCVRKEVTEEEFFKIKGKRKNRVGE